MSKIDKDNVEENLRELSPEKSNLYGDDANRPRLVSENSGLLVLNIGKQVVEVQRKPDIIVHRVHLGSA